MKKKPQQPMPLLDPQLALHDYLNALLNEVEDWVDEDAQGDTEPELNTGLSDSVASLEAVAVPISRVPGSHAGEVSGSLEPGIPVATQQATNVEIPTWAQGDFQALCFKVAGVTLATPLVKLNGIIELQQELTELPGYAPWVMGILSNRGQQTQVVDLAHLILPEGRQAEAGDARERVHYVILVNDGQFGLAADSLSQVMTLLPDEVRWRTANSRRPWLAGMVIDKMCAILDIEQLNQQMASTSKSAVSKR